MFVLHVDADTLQDRLDQRPDDEWGRKTRGASTRPRLHATKEDTPSGVALDATRPLGEVIDDILRRVEP